MIILILVGGSTHAGILNSDSVTAIKEAPVDLEETRALITKKCHSLWSGERANECRALAQKSFFMKQDVAYCTSSSYVNFELVDCLKKIENRHYSDELLDICKKNQSAKDWAAGCLHFFTETSSSYDSAGVLFCIKKEPARMRGLKDCFSHIRDREVDAEKIQRCLSKQDLIGEPYEDCLEKNLRDARILSKTNCSPSPTEPAAPTKKERTKK